MYVNMPISNKMSKTRNSKSKSPGRKSSRTSKLESITRKRNNDLKRRFKDLKNIDEEDLTEWEIERDKEQREFRNDVQQFFDNEDALDLFMETNEWRNEEWNARMENKEESLATKLAKIKPHSRQKRTETMRKLRVKRNEMEERREKEWEDLDQNKDPSSGKDWALEQDEMQDTFFAEAKEMIDDEDAFQQFKLQYDWKDENWKGKLRQRGVYVGKEGELSFDLTSMDCEEESRSNVSDQQDEEDSEDLEVERILNKKSRQRLNNRNMLESDTSEVVNEEEQYTQANDGYESEATAHRAGNKNKPVKRDGVQSAKKSKKLILFCKGKVTVPQSDNPTSKLRKVLGSYITTLVKVDTTCVLYKFQDTTNTQFINNPTQVPEMPSKIKEYFKGRYRSNSKQQDVWFEFRIGFTKPEEIFIEDARALLQSKPGMVLWKKDLQVEEVEEVGFFLFSRLQQNKKRIIATLKRCIKDR